MTITFAAHVLASGAVGAEVKYRNEFGPYEDFEVVEPPGPWEPREQLSVTHDVCKSGRRSMRWDFSAGDELTYVQAISGIPARDGGMNVWIFSPVARKAPLQLRVRTRQDGQWVECARVPFFLNYVGWRLLSTLWSPMVFETAEEALPDLRVSLVAPPESGWLAFDAVDWNMRRRADTVAPDGQMPWSRWELHPAYGRHVQAFCDWMPMPGEQGLLLPETLSEEQREGIRTLRARVVEAYPANASNDKSAWPLAKLRQGMGTFRIKRQGNIVMGAPLQQMYADYPLRDGVQVDSFGRQLLRLARSWHSHGEQDRGELEAMITDLTDYVDQQGWAYGSQASAGHAVPFMLNRSINTRVIALAMAPLKEIGRWERFVRMLSWYNGLERLGSAHAAGAPNAGEEVYRGYADKVKSLLPIILLGDDDRKVCAQLAALSIAFSNGVKEQYTPDGSTYAHHMHHPAYAYSACNVVTQHAMMLEGTVFQIDRAALRNLLNAVYVGTFAAVRPSDRAIVGNFHGRPAIGTAGFAIDRMARAIADHADVFEGHEKAQDVVNWANGSNQQGHVSMWNNSLAMHRRSDWLVSCRGMGPWVASMEIYHWTEGNNYANLMPYGSILFARASDEPRTVKELEPGWNWNFVPGATSRVLPQHKRFAPPVRNKGQFFAANLHDQGVSGMCIRDVPEVEANTSVFYFDNLVVCLGSDIRTAGDEDSRMVTTLLQLPSDAEAPVTLGDEPATTGEFSLESGCVVRDGRGIAYVVPHQRNTVLRASERNQSWTYFYQRYLRDPDSNPGLRRGSVDAEQASTHPELAAYYTPTEKRHTRVWFEHDPQAIDGSYRYAMLIDGNPDDENTVLAGLEQGSDRIAVLQQDRRAHVAACPAKGLYGAAFFEAGGTGWGKVPWVSGSTALMLEERAGVLEGTVHDPSRYPRDEAKAPSEITLVVAGNWGVASGATRVAGAAGQTTIRVRCEHSRQSSFRLVRRP